MKLIKAIFKSVAIIKIILSVFIIYAVQAEEIKIISENGVKWNYKINTVEFFGPVNINSKNWNIIAGKVKATLTKNNSIKNIYASQNVKLEIGNFISTSPNINFDSSSNIFTFLGKHSKNLWGIKSFTLSSQGKGELKIDSLHFIAENRIRFKDDKINLFGSADKISIDFYKPKSNVIEKDKLNILIKTISLSGKIRFRINNYRFSGNSLIWDTVNKSAKLCGNSMWIWYNSVSTAECYTLDLANLNILSDGRISIIMNKYKF